MTYEPCSPGCPGWAIFDCDGRSRAPYVEVERCDDCGRFESDTDARQHVAHILRTLATLILEDDGERHQAIAEGLRGGFTPGGLERFIA